MRWFAENLRFRTADSRCYEGDEVNCEDHGRLYRLEDALQACPDGWRVPTEEDWRRLERAVGVSPAEIEREKGRGEPAGRRLKFGGDTGFDDRDVATDRNSIWRSPVNVTYWLSVRCVERR